MARAIGWVVLTLIGAGSCHPCPDPDCGPSLDLVQWCGRTRLCLLDGQVAEPIVTTWLDNGTRYHEMPFLAAGVTLTIPLDQAWLEVADSGDLDLDDRTAPPAADLREASLRFDGQHAPESLCSRRESRIECIRLPHTIKTLEFRIDSGDVDLAAWITNNSDPDCEICGM